MNPKWRLGMEGRAPSEGGASLSCGHMTRGGAQEGGRNGQKRGYLFSCKDLEF